MYYDWAKETNRRMSRAKCPVLWLTPFWYDLFNYREFKDVVFEDVVFDNNRFDIDATKTINL